MPDDQPEQQDWRAERARLLAEITAEWSGEPEELSAEEQAQAERAWRAATAPPLSEGQRRRLGPIVGDES